MPPLVPPFGSPSAYAAARLQVIAAEMCLLDLSARRHEAAFAAADGDVGDAFHETWDRAIADWWHLAEEAEALGADLDPASSALAGSAQAGSALAGIAEATEHMLQVSLEGSC